MVQKMKLSSNTIKILKNFSTINNSILIRRGDVLNTISSYSDIVAEATLDEVFPRECAIYDLSKFLGVYQMMGEPELTFEDSFVTLSSDNKKTFFVYTDKTNVKTMDDEIEMPEIIETIHLSSNDIETLLQASSVMKLSDFNIVSDGAAVILTATDRKNSSAGSFVVNSQQHSTKKFSVSFKFEQLKLFSGDYDVKITESAAQFSHSSGRLQYWVAADECVVE
jgi:hypothetical protein